MHDTAWKTMATTTTVKKKNVIFGLGSHAAMIHQRHKMYSKKKYTRYTYYCTRRRSRYAHQNLRRSRTKQGTYPGACTDSVHCKHLGDCPSGDCPSSSHSPCTAEYARFLQLTSRSKNVYYDCHAFRRRQSPRSTWSRTAQPGRIASCPQGCYGASCEQREYCKQCGCSLADWGGGGYRTSGKANSIPGFHEICIKPTVYPRLKRLDREAIPSPSLKPRSSSATSNPFDPQ